MLNCCTFPDEKFPVLNWESILNVALWKYSQCLFEGTFPFFWCCESIVSIALHFRIWIWHYIQGIHFINSCTDCNHTHDLGIASTTFYCLSYKNDRTFQVLHWQTSSSILEILIQWISDLLSVHIHCTLKERGLSCCSLEVVSNRPIMW